jgi:hypothetical protein
LQLKRLDLEEYPPSAQPASGWRCRGQIAKAFGRAGVPAVNTDFITFARSVEPATA